VSPIAIVPLDGVRVMLADAADADDVSTRGAAATSSTDKMRIMRFTINTIITDQSA
jgi:hypothetical protein